MFEGFLRHLHDRLVSLMTSFVRKLKRPENRNVGKSERPESRNDRKSRNTEMIPVFWRTDAPAPIGDPDGTIIYLLYFLDFFLVRCAHTIGTGWFGAPIVLAHYKVGRHVCLLTQKSLNNRALLRGNEYTMLKRRQQNFEINRHR
jgi:hypothetical protein